jgi:hypothetical protein
MKDLKPCPFCGKEAEFDIMSGWEEGYIIIDCKRGYRVMDFRVSSWINVKDGLPEWGQRVIAYERMQDEVFCASYFPDEKEKFDCFIIDMTNANKHIFENEDCHKDFEITHWMPLPDKPE